PAGCARVRAPADLLDDQAVHLDPADRRLHRLRRHAGDAPDQCRTARPSAVRGDLGLRHRGPELMGVRLLAECGALCALGHHAHRPTRYDYTCGGPVHAGLRATVPLPRGKAGRWLTNTPPSWSSGWDASGPRRPPP